MHKSTTKKLPRQKTRRSAPDHTPQTPPICQDFDNLSVKLIDFTDEDWDHELALLLGGHDYVASDLQEAA